MQIELNRATFVRLVQLYIASAILSLSVIAYTSFATTWQPFNNEFDALVAHHSDEPSWPDWMWWAFAGLLITILIWMLASMIGLLWFKRWARTGLWASLIGSFVLAGLMFGNQPSSTTILDDVLVLLDSGLFGAIFLLSYAKGYGSDWFALASNVHEGQQ